MRIYYVMSNDLPDSIANLFRDTPSKAPSDATIIVDGACIDFDDLTENKTLWEYLSKQHNSRIIIGSADVEKLDANLAKAPIPEAVEYDIQHWDTINLPLVQTIITDNNPELDGFVIPDHYAMIPKIAVESDGLESYLTSCVTSRNEERAEPPYLNLDEANDIWNQLKGDESLRNLVGSFRRASDPNNADVMDTRYQHAMHALYQYFIAYGNNRVTKQSDSQLTVSAAKATFSRVAEQMSALDDVSATPDGLPHMSTKQLLSFARSYVRKEVDVLTKPYEPPSRN